MGKLRQSTARQVAQAGGSGGAGTQRGSLTPKSGFTSQTLLLLNIKGSGGRGSGTVTAQRAHRFHTEDAPRQFDVPWEVLRG